MDDKHKKILLELMNHQSLKSADLQALLQVSSRTIRNLINRINSQIKGAIIESGSFGYRLQVSDPEALIRFLQNSQDENQDRCSYIFIALSAGGTFVKVDDLCDALYLSRSQLKQELKKVREYFGEYDVTIMDKPYHGLYLEGQEINIRRAIAHFQDFQKESRAYGQIRDIVHLCIRDFDYRIADDVLENIIVHLYIAYSRMQNQEYAHILDTWLEETKKEKEYPLACAIMELISKLLGVDIIEAETAYLTIHLCSKKANSEEFVYIDQNTYDVVNNMLLVLERQTRYVFTKDLNLQLALSLHLIALEKRIRYHTYLHNPLINEIKQKFIASYELAMQSTQVINDHFNCSLPEGEIAYFALHINLALEKNLINTTRKNILLVCSSGAGSAMLLRHFFQTNFSNHIDRLEVSSAHQLDSLEIDDFDCVFTTIPLDRNLKIPVFLINSLVDNSDVSLIKSKLEKLESVNVLNHFPEDLFFVNQNYSSREQAIEDIVLKIQARYDLDPGFMDLVFKREALAATEFNNMVAFPHGLKPRGILPWYRSRFYKSRCSGTKKKSGSSFWLHWRTQSTSSLTNSMG